jgi:hypothetical protein
MHIHATFSILNCFDSRLYHLFNSSKLFADNTPTKASDSIVIMRQDLLLVAKVVIIGPIDVVELSDIIFIEFTV